MNASRLSRRETEVLRLSAEGLTPEQIAHKLIVTPATVNRYMARVREKLGAFTNPMAVLIAVRRYPKLLSGVVYEHGTPKALDAHEANGTPLCTACAEFLDLPKEIAPVTQDRSPYRRLTPPALSLNGRKGAPVECGSIQAANRHIRKGEKIAELTCACPEAYRAWWQAYRRIA
jgi:DNA-binding CsgD family transcriptional regulator